MRRVVSLWLPRFATDRQRLLRRRSGGLAQVLLSWRRSAPAELAFTGRPFGHPRAVAPFRDHRTLPARRDGGGGGEREPAFATIREEGGRCLIAAVNAAAAADGIGPGLALADARALLPSLATAPADPAGDAAALDRLADWCGRYTPLAAVERADDGAGAGLWLDVSGCTHLFGGEAALVADLLGRLAAFGFAARAGMADTPGMAWAAARFLAAGEGSAIVTPGAARAALKPLPLAALRLPPALQESLAQVGLRRVGEALALPRAALARRFGTVLLQRLDQALGRAEEPLSPRQPAPPHRVRLAFPEPIAAPEDLAAGLQRLLGALCRGLAVAEEGARRLELALYRVDGSVQRTGIGTSRPLRDPEALARLFAPHLERLEPGYGVEVMVLAAPAAEPLSALQLVLASPSPHPPPARGGGDVLAAESPLPLREGDRGRGEGDVLAELIDTLANRLGLDAIRRCVPRQSHLPERSVETVPPLAAVDGPARWPATAPRPVRLLRAPEPVEALSPFALLQAPDHAGPSAVRVLLADMPKDRGEAILLPQRANPLSRLRERVGVRAGAVGTVEPFETPLPEAGAAPAAFRWRGRVHRIARAEGPERIAPEWWRPAAGEARDYYRVEDADGRRFWLYRTVPAAVHPSAACSAPEGTGMVTLTRKGSDRDGAPENKIPIPSREGSGEGVGVRDRDPSPCSISQGEGGSMPRWYLHGLFA
jgi:protein ImuB